MYLLFESPVTILWCCVSLCFFFFFETLVIKLVIHFSGFWIQLLKLISFQTRLQTLVFSFPYFSLFSVCCYKFAFSTNNRVGTAVAQWLRCFSTNRKDTGSIPAGVSGFFIDIKSFRPHYGPGVDSACNRNEYEEHFLVVKAAGA